jgi:uncharacterized glyoxalase superfamily protein PhnB
LTAGFTANLTARLTGPLTKATRPTHIPPQVRLAGPIKCAGAPQKIAYLGASPAQTPHLHCGCCGRTVPGTGAALVFLHVHDARALWKRLMAEQITRIGPVQDQDYGLREFVISDPDGNRPRIGSPIHE